MSRHKEPWTISGKIEVRGVSSGMVEVTHPGFDRGRWVGYYLDRQNAASFIADLAKAISESERLEKEAKQRREEWEQRQREEQAREAEEEIREAAKAAQEMRGAKTLRQAA
jgi:hypothetical protein